MRFASQLSLALAAIVAIVEANVAFTSTPSTVTAGKPITLTYSTDASGPVCPFLSYFLVVQTFSFPVLEILPLHHICWDIGTHEKPISLAS